MSAPRKGSATVTALPQTTDVALLSLERRLAGATRFWGTLGGVEAPPIF